MSALHTSQASDNLLVASVARLWLDVVKTSPEISQIVVTGCTGGEGATTVAQALAFAAASSGVGRVLLIDAARSRHGLSSLFGKHAAPPSRATKDEASKPTVNGARPIAPGVDFLPIGWAASAEPSDRDIRDLSEKAQAGYDLVIWDSPAVLRSVMALRLIAEAGSVLLVARTDATTNVQLTATLNEIEIQGAQTLAVLRNRAGRKLFGFGAD